MNDNVKWKWTVLCALLLVLILGWAAKRIIHRPQRTVWLPDRA